VNKFSFKRKEEENKLGEEKVVTFFFFFTAKMNGGPSGFSTFIHLPSSIFTHPFLFRFSYCFQFLLQSVF